MTGNGHNGNGRGDGHGGNGRGNGHGVFRDLFGWMMAGMTKLPGLLNCRDADAFLLDYVEGNLPRDKVRLFERHLMLCPDCQRYLDAYRKSVELGRHAFDEPDADAASAMPDDLVKAILEARDAAAGPAE